VEVKTISLNSENPINMYPFIAATVKDLLLLLCIPLVAELAVLLFSKQEELSDDPDIEEHLLF
jgi:hypothetical protein